MKLNVEGLALIAAFLDEYDPAETPTNAEKAIRLYVHPLLTSNQFSALVCLVMDIGIIKFRKSVLLKKINSKTDRNALVHAADEFDRYVYELNEKGVREIEPFLVRQREFEKALFLKPELVSRKA